MHGRLLKKSSICPCVGEQERAATILREQVPDLKEKQFFPEAKITAPLSVTSNIEAFSSVEEQERAATILREQVRPGMTCFLSEE